MKETLNSVNLLHKGFGLHLQIRASPKNKFKLRGVHLNPHAKCRYSKFNLKLFKKEKNGGHLKPGNTLVWIVVLYPLNVMSVLTSSNE